MSTNSHEPAIFFFVIILYQLLKVLHPNSNVCGGQAVVRHPPGVPQFHLILTLSTCREHQIPQVRVGVYKTAPVASPHCHLCYRSEVPKTPSSCLTDLLQQLTELRDVSLTRSLFSVRGCNVGAAQETRGARCGERARSSHARSTPLSQHHHMFANPEALQTQSSWVFMASLYRHD